MESLDFSTISFQGIIVSPTTEKKTQYAGSTNSEEEETKQMNENNKIDIDKYFNKQFIKKYFSD